MSGLSNESIKALLDAQVASAAIVLLIVMVVGTIFILRLTIPLWKRQGDTMYQQTIILKSLQQTISDLKLQSTTQHAEQVDAIRALQKSLDNHMVSINVRFDSLPAEIRQHLGIEMVRQFTNGQSAPARGLLGRLLGW